MLRAADLFCGAGGTSIGAHATGGVNVRFAVNHWPTAIATHSANFPHTKHFNARIDQVDPRECDGIDLLFASPECTHHSNARGGRPMEDQRRAGAWDVLKWVEHHRPSWVVVENVREFVDWGPLAEHGRPIKRLKGALFNSWLAAMKALGYAIDFRLLNAADFGAATSRLRLFVIARKGGRKILWPEPTHCQTPGGELPGLSLPRWRAAAEIIDWSLPCPSVFGRKRLLKEKTIRRIEIGLRRFVGPFVTQWDQQGSTGNRSTAVASPLGTLVTKANRGLAIPYTVTLRNNATCNAVGNPIDTITAGGRHHGLAMPYLTPNFGEAPGQMPRTHSLDESMPTVTGHGAGCLAVPYLLPRQGFYDCHRDKPCKSVETPLGTITANHCPAGVVVPYLVSVNHGDGATVRDRSCPVDVPTNALTTHREFGVALPFLSSYYGQSTASDLREPLDTVTCRDRHAIIVPELGTLPDLEGQPAYMQSLIRTCLELGVCDIGFRMLSNPELSAAQGFPASYLFTGTKADVTRQIGNSVSPNVAEAITKAILSA